MVLKGNINSFVRKNRNKNKKICPRSVIFQNFPGFNNPLPTRGRLNGLGGNCEVLRFLDLMNFKCIQNANKDGRENEKLRIFSFVVAFFQSGYCQAVLGFGIRNL